MTKRKPISPPKELSYYTLTMSFKCRTKKQAKELSNTLNQVFSEKIDEWTGGFASKFEKAKRVNVG